jgi:hypothetical protein
MPWPQATDYNEAIQNPGFCFADPELQQGRATTGIMGVIELPLAHSGNFADVYQMNCPGGQTWAVKCFTRQVHGLRDRYQAISDHLQENGRPFMVPFHYLEEGVRVNGAWYPSLKMRWVEGTALNVFIGQQADRPAVLERLAQMWVRLARELREARIAHGDLQHGNVLLVPGTKKTGGLGLRLIDYDGLWVPGLADRPSGESGHPNYQHPRRLREGAYNGEVDRFSHLAIYTALRCLAVGGRGLWERHENGENLLFREADFSRPQEAKLWPELWAQGGDARTLTGQLLLASQGPQIAVPLLDELFEDGDLRPLTRSEEEQVKEWIRLPVGSRRSAVVRPGVPPLPSPLEGGLRTLADERETEMADAGTGPIAAVPVAAHLPALPALAPPLAVAIPVGVPPAIPPVPVPVVVPEVMATAVAGPLPVAVPAVPVARVVPLPPPILVGVPPVPRLAAVPVPLPPSPPPIPQAPPLQRPLTPPELPASERLPPLRPKGMPPVLGASIAAGIVVALIVGLWLAFRHSGGAREEPSTPEPQLARIVSPGDFDVLTGTEHQLTVQIDRRGSKKPLALRLDGLPEEAIKCDRVFLKPEAISAVLTLRTSRNAPLGVLNAQLKLFEEDGPAISVCSLNVSVKLRALPRFKQATGNVTLRAGEVREVTAEIDLSGVPPEAARNLSLWIEDLPDGIQQEPGSSARAGLLRLTLTARPNARPFAKIASLTLRQGEEKVDDQPLILAVVPEGGEGPPMRGVNLLASATFTVTAGESRDLKVIVERGGFDGELELRLVSRLKGVKAAEAVKLAGNQSECFLKVQAEETAEGEAQGRIEAWAGEVLMAFREVTLGAQRPGAVAPPRPRLVPLPEEVHFPAADQLDLHGTLYPGPDGKKSPAVLLLHDLGHDRKEADWVRLAERLQQQGYGVLTFDFRGHGDSVKLPNPVQNFWRHPLNAQLRKAVLPATLNHQDFPPLYLPQLVNDIAAARLFLEQQHDAGKLNASAFVVIGAGEGATLGQFWLAAEAYRIAGKPPGQMPQNPFQLQQSEARQIAAAIWIGSQLKLGPAPGLNPNAANLFAKIRLGTGLTVPMVFLYPARDPFLPTARTLFRTRAGLGSVEVVAVGEKVGADEVLSQVDKIFRAAPPPEWAERGIDRLGFYWGFPGSSASWAKLPSSNRLTHLVPIALAVGGLP